MAVKCSNRTLWTTSDEDGYSYWVEFEDRSFTKGNSKFMYKGRLNGKGPRLGDYCTLKVLKTVDIAKHEDWDLYINRAKKANELAAQFNKMIDNQYKVKFLVPMLGLIDISSTCTDCIYFLSNTKRIRSDDCVAVEPYIGRKFRKFYPNSPLKGAENAYILQAFSHFTASQTRDTLICGLQGVAKGTEFYLTNPIIHSVDQQWGPKDQGPQGFKDFFAAHTCNSICQSMDLPEYLETAPVPEQIEHHIDEVDADVEKTPENVISVSTGSINQDVTHSDADSVQETKVTTLDTSSSIKETPSVLQTPPMTHVGRTIVAPVSMEISVSRSSSVVGPPSFAEDVPGESISRPSAESVILDATPIDDIATQLSDTQEAVPPPSSEYLGPPCVVNEHLELQKSFASFSPGSENIPMIDDELACAESEMKEVLPLPSDDFEPTMSPSLNSYLKDKESLEIIPHSTADIDLESQPSTSVFEENAPVPVLGSVQMTPRESITHDKEMFESLVNTPCGTMSQESLVTTPCGSIQQELDSQPSVVSTSKDDKSQNLIPVSEPPLEPELNLDVQQSIESSHDVESEVCLVSIPPDCMDHHLDTLESLEALSPASEKLTSVELPAEPKGPPEEAGGECVEPDAKQVVEEQISVEEFPETQTIQKTGRESLETFPLDNVEDEVQKSICTDSMSSDFKQSLETIPEGSTESDSAHSLENEILAPETSTGISEAADDTTAVESTGGTVAENQTVETTDVGQGGMMAETTSEIQSGPTLEATPEAAVTEKTVENATEIPTEGATVSQETTVEVTAKPEGEASISQETTSETNAEAIEKTMASQETTVETAAEPVGEALVSPETAVDTAAEPVRETTVSQETTVETSAQPVEEATVSQEATIEASAQPVEEATVSQETTVETSAQPVEEATVSQETTVETTAEPVGEATMSQETTVETSAQPVEEATVSQETTVETTAEPVGEATMSQETTVETSAEPVGETTMSQETTVETSAEPVGEATVSQETTIDTSAQPVGEATVSQETTIETSSGPVGETNAEPEREVVFQETTVESAGECYQNQETAEPVTQESNANQETPMGEATVSQDTVIETKEEANIETTGDTYVNQDTVVESTSAVPEDCVGDGSIVQSSAETTGEGYVAQEATVETTAESNIYQGSEGYASQQVATESTIETTGESYVCQDTGLRSTAGEAYVSQEMTSGSAIEAAGECSMHQYSGSTVGTAKEGYICQESGLESTVESTGEGYVCPKSAVETTAESGHDSQDIKVGMAAEGCSVQNTEFESNVGTTFEPVTSAYPAEANSTMSSQTSDPDCYGVPPEYKISEDNQSSLCEAGCPQTYPKMTIVSDLDTVEYVETKHLDSVCEEHDTQQGIETLPRRTVSYYLEPQESLEIITFRINISPEVTKPNQQSEECTYQNVGTACQCSNSSVDDCTTCQTQETSETVGETSGQDSERSSNFYTYHYTDTSDCMESMPQRTCGYSTDVHQNLPPDWSPTHSICDDGQCSTAQNLQTTLGGKVDSKFGSTV